ncbi:MAG: insulinase family protein [Cyclobacteriaceae bacterium]
MILDRTTPPPSYPLESFSFPGSDKRIIEVNQNRVPALLINNPQHPIVFFDLILESGRWHESEPGIAFHAAKMLTEGTRKMNAEDISFAFENLGSYIDIQPGLDNVSIKVYALKKNLSATIDILIELIEDSIYPEDVFTIQQEIRIQQIQQQLSKNSQLASIEFHHHLFGPNHPYGQKITPDIVAGIELDQVKDYYHKSLFNQPKIVISGDLGNSEVQEIERLIASLPALDIPFNQAKIDSSEGNYTVEKGGSQASVRIGHLSIDKNDPDIHITTVANSLLGGFFGSRLMKNVREEKGLTYGIHSSLIHFAHQSMYVISSEMAKDKLDQGMEAIQFEVNRLIETKPSQDEIHVLKSYLRGKLLATMDSVFSISNLYKALFMINKDESFLHDYLDVLENMSPDQIQNATASQLNITDSTTVIVS